MVSVRQVNVESKKEKRLRRRTFFKTWLLYSACSIIYSFFFFFFFTIEQSLFNLHMQIALVGSRWVNTTGLVIFVK